jgi:hypothetical protein
MRARHLLAALLALLVCAAPAGAGQPVRSYESRPDLAPVVLQARTSEPGLAPGTIFLAPKRGQGQGGPLIAGNDGQPIWFLPLSGGRRATDFRVQEYGGRRVLTWWEGIASGGQGEGEGVIADESYRVIARVRTGNGVKADLHEFKLTPRGTALLMSYHTRNRDLRAFGGSRRGRVIDGVVQEVDIATGRVLFQWRSMGQVGLRESYVPVPRGRTPFDYIHLNSIDMDAAGDLLVSARHTHAVYKIRRSTGEVAWRLGGKRSSFRLGRGTSIALQHDARFEADGTIRIFDNSSRRLRERSRVIWVRVSTEQRTAQLVREIHHPDDVLSGTQANAQVLPDGHVLVGWGSQGRISEFDAGGRLLLDLKLPRGWDTYRAYREPWVGRPLTAPAIAAELRDGGGVTVYASWNGATEVAGWQVLAGPAATSLAVVGTAPRRGFETQIRLPAAADFVTVRALDASGAVLGTSRVVDVT